MSAPALVERRGQQALTTSLAVAEGCGISHQSALRLVKKYATEFGELGFLGFEIQENRGTQGAPTEYAVLNEDCATFLITMFKNTPVVLKFKLRLVKAFRKAIDEINRLYANPPRTGLLADKRAANKTMNGALVEIRAEVGKETSENHYRCEARLCNWALTGRFEKLDEKTLTNEQVALLEQIRDRNRAFLLAGLDYSSRKARLNAYALRQRTRLIGTDWPERPGRPPLAVEPMLRAG